MNLFVVMPGMTKFRQYNPLVSVIIPTRNRPRLLRKALESVLGQTYAAVDIIVVDDASMYETQNLLSKYVRAHDNLRVIRNHLPQGPCRSRNRGIRAAQGDLISFLDDDDEWLRQRLTVLAGSFELEYAYICSDYWIQNARGLSLQRLPRSITYQDMLYRNRTGNTVLAETELVRSVGGFDESLEARQDYDLWLRLLETTPGKTAQVVPQPLHIVNKTQEDRLSVSVRAYRGKRRFFLKHRSKMNPWQRRFQRIKLRKLQHKNLVWKDHVCSWIVRKRLKYLPSQSIWNI